MQRCAGEGPGCVDARLQRGEQMGLIGVAGDAVAERLVAGQEETRRVALGEVFPVILKTSVADVHCGQNAGRLWVWR